MSFLRSVPEKSIGDIGGAKELLFAKVMNASGRIGIFFQCCLWFFFQMHVMASKQTFAIISICTMIILGSTFTEACGRGPLHGHCRRCRQDNRQIEYAKRAASRQYLVKCFKEIDECEKNRLNRLNPLNSHCSQAYCKISDDCTTDDTIGLFCVRP